MIKINQSTKIVVSAFFLLTLSSCNTLISALATPKVNAEFEELKSGQYRLDRSHAALIFKIQHMGLSTYIGRFNVLNAELDFDPSNIESINLTADVEIASLDINDEDLKDDLMGRSWFNQSQFPLARISTQKVERLKDNQILLTLNLDWRGVQKPIKMTATFHGGANNVLTGAYTLGFSSVGSFNRSDFGMKKFIPLVGDEVVLEAFGEFQKSQ